MKQIILVAIVLLWFPAVFYAHEEPSKTIAEKKQKEKDRKSIQSHKTKTATIWNCKISEDGTKTDVKTKNVISSYDKHGNLSEVKVFQNDSLDIRLVFQRDDSNNMTAETGYDSNNKITENIIYKYDDQGRIIEQFNYDNEKDFVSKFIYSVNYKDNTVLFTKFKPDSTIDYYLTYQYNGNPDSSENSGIVKLSPDKDTIMLVKNSFDEKKRRIKKEIYDEQMKLSYYFQYEYVENTEDISEIKQISAEDSLMATIKYIYDTEGMISEIQSYNEDNILISSQGFTYEQY